MNNLRKIRNEKNLTLQDVATELNSSPQVISRYERGEREPDQATLKILARFYGVSIDFILGGEKTSIVERNIFDIPDIYPVGETELIPLVGTIACGTPTLAEENIDDFIKADRSLHATFALYCRGDSMINARIFDGDIVYIRQQSDVDNGEIAAVLIGDTATLKRVYKYKDRLELRAENPTFAPINFEGEEMNSILILGKAVAFLSAIR